ncbi:MAG: hypothetical protein U9N36_08330 [Euryarchaeota archaeon]|nr:hypothetical protein [Euryarchaeota archaeon]
MAESKKIIEKIWWVIPPVAVALFIPLRMAVWEMTHFNRPVSSFVSLYAKNILISSFHFLSFWGVIVTISTIVFMGAGYYLSRNRYVVVRIVVPIITAIIGHYISTVLISLLVFMY